MVIVVGDDGSPSLSATQSFVVVVNEVNSAPTLAPIVERTIHQGMTLTITNSALDLDVPANQLTYSLSNAPAGASINASVFIWTPAPEQANSTNTITVVITDDGSPNLSDAKEFTVTVLPPPTIVSIALVETNVNIVWTAIAGTTYRVQYKSDLQEMDWHDLPEEVVAGSDTAMQNDAVGPHAQRFYRILVR